jgi:hypothetical protein
VDDSLGLCDCPCYQIDYLLAAFFLTNRLCEICGETAKNVSVAANNGFMEEWNDR